MRDACIHAEKGHFPLAVLARVWVVARSGYYAWAARRASATSQSNRVLLERIRSAHEQSRTRYGSPRIHAELRAQGVRCSRKRVARLMKLHWIGLPTRRKFRSTTDSKHGLPVAENVLHRQFEQAKPNAAWVTEITYIPTREGWLYLAALLDVHSCKVVGWSRSERIDTQLVLDAFSMACQGRTPQRLDSSLRSGRSIGQAMPIKSSSSKQA